MPAVANAVPIPVDDANDGAAAERPGVHGRIVGVVLVGVVLVVDVGVGVARTGVAGNEVAEGGLLQPELPRSGARAPWAWRR